VTRAADYGDARIRVRKVSETGVWIFRRGVYEIEHTELGSDVVTWTRQSSSPTEVLRPFYGQGDAWSIVQAADAATPPGAWVSFYDEDA
jgi:hypothetical protein